MRKDEELMRKDAARPIYVVVTNDEIQVYAGEARPVLLLDYTISAADIDHDLAEKHMTTITFEDWDSDVSVFIDRLADADDKPDDAEIAAAAAFLLSDTEPEAVKRKPSLWHWNKEAV